MDHAFQWNDSYSVKVDAMDDQHQQLFKIVNELHTAMRSGKGKDVAANLLRRLIDYTVQHFAAEEKLMEQKGYPGLTAHQAEHRALTHKVVTFKKDFDAGIVKHHARVDEVPPGLAHESHPDGRPEVRRVH